MPNDTITATFTKQETVFLRECLLWAHSSDAKIKASLSLTNAEYRVLMSTIWKKFPPMPDHFAGLGPND